MRAAEDHRRAHQAHRGPAPAHRARQLHRRPAGRARAARRVPPQRARACAHRVDRLHGGARGAGRRRGAHRGRSGAVEAAARDLAHEGLLRDADPAARARQGALCRRADRRRRRREPLPRRGRARADRDRIRAARRCRPTRSRRARAGAPLLHEEAGTNVLVAREFKRGDVDAAFAQAPVTGRRPLPHAPQDAAGDRAARVPRRIRAGPRRAHACIRRRKSPASSATRSPTRSTCRATACAWSRRMSAAASAARVRSIRRRSSSARRRGSSARPVKWTSDRMEDLAATSQAFDEIVDAELALDRDGTLLALRADVIGDVGAYSIYPWTAALEPVQVVSFLPGPYRDRALSRPRARRSRPASRRPGPIAASAGRSRPSSWSA